MNPTTVQTVVTYDTIIEFAKPELKLFPGMTAYVTIPVATVKDVLKIPNTALRYKPPLGVAEIAALYKQFGIDTPEKAAATESAGDPPEQNRTRAPKSETAVVWKLQPGNQMAPVKVSLGITDHAYTKVIALLKGDLKWGDDVLIRSVTSKTQGPGTLRR